MKLTVIIPMYNCCQNVSQTLQKLSNQLGRRDDPERLEVIVIDDGSTDQFAPNVKLECLARGFTYYRQDNAGGAAACNRGLEMASGDYITFVDADDTITDCYVEVVLQEIMTGEYDFITHCWEYPNGQIGVRHELPLVNWNVWGNMYRTSLVRDVKFDEDINVSWDMDWLRRAYQPSMRQLNSDRVTNIYDTSNPASITNKFSRGEITIRKSDTKPQP